MNHISKLKISTYFLYLFLIGLFAAWIWITLVPIFHGVFFITFDQGRDFLWVKNQVELQKLYLVGPWGSLAGVFFGPFWFWLLIIPYLITDGHPIGFSVFNALIVMSSVVVSFFLLRKKVYTAAIFVVILGLLSVGLRGISTFAFSQHLLPLLTVLLLWSYVQITSTARPIYVFISLFIIGLMFHAEPPTSIFSLPSLFLLLLFTKNVKKMLTIKNIVLSAIAFVLPFAPLLLFDLRHDFIQVKAVLAYFQGNNESLQGILPFSQRIIDRTLKFIDIFRSATSSFPLFISVLLLITNVLTIWKLNKDTYISTVARSIGIYILSLWLIFVLYPPELKMFYLDGIIILFVIFHALFLAILWRNKYLKVVLVGYIFYLFIQNIQPMQHLALSQSDFSSVKTATSVYSNQKKIIDWIYTQADGKGFKVYTYSPAIYDYPYQYLFLQYGLKTFGYLPEEFSYLPNQPEYVQDKSLVMANYQDKLKKAEIIFLIIDPGQKDQGYKNDWLSNFPHTQFPVEKNTTFLDQTTVELRSIAEAND